MGSKRVIGSLKAECSMMRSEFSKTGAIGIENVEVNSYLLAVAGHFIRQKLLEVRASFSFETVMSSQDKIKFFAMPHSTTLTR